MMTNLAKLTEN